MTALKPTREERKRFLATIIAAMERANRLIAPGLRRGTLLSLYREELLKLEAHTETWN